jgi:hypothetical protein
MIIFEHKIFFKVFQKIVNTIFLFYGTSKYLFESLPCSVRDEMKVNKFPWVPGYLWKKLSPWVCTTARRYKWILFLLRRGFFMLFFKKVTSVH